MLTTKRIATVLGVAAAAMTLTLAVSGPAFAGVDKTAWTAAGDGIAANACDLRFVSAGDHFYLDDNLKDGAGCYGFWTADGRSGEMWDKNGAGTTVGYNFNFTEGSVVTFEVCAENNSSQYIDTCNDQQATA